MKHLALHLRRIASQCLLPAKPRRATICTSLALICSGWQSALGALSPDLTISSLTHSPLSPTTNSQVLLTAVVRNIGLGPAGTSVLTLQLSGESSPTRYNVPALDPLAEYKVTRLVQVTAAGLYQVTAVADADDTVSELLELNNTQTDSIAVSIPTADLRVLSLTHTPLNPTTADTITFTAVVINSGTGDAGPSTLTLRIGTESTPASFSIPSLAPNAIHSVTRQEQLPAQSYDITATADATGAVPEYDETNNTRTESLTVSGAQPDLIVLSLTHSPVNPTTTDPVTFTAILKNTGTASAGASVLTLLIAGETVPTSHSIPALAPDAMYTVTRTQLLALAQSYSVTATADAAGAVPEADETNNTRTDSVTVKAAQPDLIVLSLTHSPLTPTTDQTVTFTAVVQNSGKADAGPSVLTLQLAGESSPTSYDIPTLAPYAIHTVERQVQLGVPQTYTLTATADANHTVAETDETNNSKTDSVTVKAAQPDLVVLSLTHSPVSPTTAELLTFTAVIQNLGTGTAEASVLTLKLGSESIPAVYDIPSLAPNAIYTVQRQELLTAVKTYTLEAAVDANHTVAESDETNNSRTDSVNVRPAQPDLVVMSLTHAPLSPTTADTVTVTAVVQNTGTSNSGPSVLSIQIGSESTPATFTIPALAPNAIHTATRQQQLTSPATYTVTATADSSNVIAEADETNNTKTDTFTVKTPQPDLVLVSLTHAPITPTTADTNTFTAVVQNLGNGPAGPCSLSFQVGTESPTAYSIPALDPNAIYTVNHLQQLSSPTAYTITATIDSANVIAESDETNNSKTDTFTVKTPQPDLVLVSLAHTPLTPTTADTITFTAVVQNLGNGEAGPSQLSLQIGTETTPATYSIPALAPNAIQTVTRQAQLTNATEYTVTVTADSSGTIAESDETNNSKTDTFTIKTPQADLVLLSLSISPLEPTTLDTVTFTAVVQNLGNGSANPSVLTLALGPGNTSYHDIPSLAPNALHTVTRQESLSVVQSYTLVATADADAAVTESDESNNAKTNTFAVKLPQPDLVVLSLTHSPLNPTTTNDITFTAVVQNAGPSNAGPSVLTLRIGNESTPGRYLVPPLAPNAIFTTNRLQRVSPAQTCQVVATADADNHVVEGNEDNNLKLDTFDVAPAGPDLAVVSLTCDPTSPFTTNVLSITAQIQNLGFSQAGACAGTLQIEGVSAPISFPVPSLAPSATSSFTWTGQISTPGPCLLTATVDSALQIVEFNESNNVLTNTLILTAPSLAFRNVRLENGVLRATLVGPGTRAVVSASTDCLTWQDLLYLALTPEGASLELPVGPQPARFYRARSD